MTDDAVERMAEDAVLLVSSVPEVSLTSDGLRDAGRTAGREWTDRR
ncbi:hypothetical protein [Natrialba chahannaoensis]|nr:hypothetical protein [Natrialba chahannaoensis]